MHHLVSFKFKLFSVDHVQIQHLCDLARFHCDSITVN